MSFKDVSHFQICSVMYTEVEILYFNDTHFIIIIIMFIVYLNENCYTIKYYGMHFILLLNIKYSICF